MKKDKTVRLVGVVTSARADYGILKSLLIALAEDPRVKLRIYITAAHLLKKFGSFWQVIKKDFPKHVIKIKTSSGKDSLYESSSIIGRASIGFGKQFTKEKPDLLVLVGDRFEILGPASVATIFAIPVVHIHGGERTDGAIDELVRHAVTKLASYHFVTTESYRKRVIQLGEDPRRVWNYGAPALDWLATNKLLSKKELEKFTGLSLDRPTALVTYHPETAGGVKSDCSAMLEAIKSSGIQAVFTQSNADPGHSKIFQQVRKLVDQESQRFVLFSNLGAQRYLSCIKHFGVLIGNSSSGIIEAPSLGAAVVNIGNRQSGRVRSRHVIDVSLEKKEIERAISKAFSARFKSLLRKEKNPYHKYRDGKVGLRIKNTLCQLPLTVKQQFFDLV